MQVLLRTPEGATVINLTKVNAVELRDKNIVILFTSEKANNIAFTYPSKDDATSAFDAYYERVARLHD